MRFYNKVCSGTTTIAPDNKTVTVQGILNPAIDWSNVQYIAAAPVEQRLSFTGSGMPFANGMQAFENTPTKGQLAVDKKGNFNVTFVMPSSYCSHLSSILIPPTLYLIYYTKNSKNEQRQGILLKQALQFRSITYPKERENVLFYEGMGTLPTRGQETILRSASYDATKSQPANFWGLKPPL